MQELTKESWIRALVFFAIAMLIFELVHTADDIIAGDLGGFSMEVLVLVCALGNTLLVFGILWSRAGKQYGYIIVGLVGLLFFFVVYVFHVFGISDSREFDVIARATPEGWSPLFVTSGIVTGIASLATIIIAAYLIIKARQST